MKVSKVLLLLLGIYIIISCGSPKKVVKEESNDAVPNKTTGSPIASRSRAHALMHTTGSGNDTPKRGESMFSAANQTKLASYGDNDIVAEADIEPGCNTFSSNIYINTYLIGGLTHIDIESYTGTPPYASEVVINVSDVSSTYIENSNVEVAYIGNYKYRCSFILKKCPNGSSWYNETIFTVKQTDPCAWQNDCIVTCTWQGKIDIAISAAEYRRGSYENRIETSHDVASTLTVQWQQVTGPGCNALVDTEVNQAYSGSETIVPGGSWVVASYNYGGADDVGIRLCNVYPSSDAWCTYTILP